MAEVDFSLTGLALLMSYRVVINNIYMELQLKAKLVLLYFCW